MADRPFAGRRWWWRSSSPRTSFSKAVPLRVDRRELRRQFRAVVRSTRAERKRRVTAGLSYLASRRVPVASVRTGVLGDELIEFADGTRIWLDVRDGTTVLRRLAARSPSQYLFLGQVDVCFGCCWYQLHFWGSGEIGPAVLARVKQYESTTTWIQRAAGSRWHRPPGGQHHG